jgi:hypothetical protein
MQDIKIFQSVISPKGDKNPFNSEDDNRHMGVLLHMGVAETPLCNHCT